MFSSYCSVLRLQQYIGATEFRKVNAKKKATHVVAFLLFNTYKKPHKS